LGGAKDVRVLGEEFEKFLVIMPGSVWQSAQRENPSPTPWAVRKYKIPWKRLVIQGDFLISDG
jgi:hypothetical protein